MCGTRVQIENGATNETVYNVQLIAVINYQTRMHRRSYRSNIEANAIRSNCVNIVQAKQSVLGRGVNDGCINKSVAVALIALLYQSGVGIAVAGAKYLPANPVAEVIRSKSSRPQSWHSLSRSQDTFPSSECMSICLML
jgi:hypothetical protein